MPDGMSFAQFAGTGAPTPAPSPVPAAPAPGGIAFDDFAKAPPAPAPVTTSGRPAITGIGANAAAGGVEGIGDILNMGLDPYSRVMGTFLGKMGTGSNAGDAEKAGLASVLGARNPLDANTDIDVLAHGGGVAAPGDVEPSDLAEGITRLAARGATAGALLGAPGEVATIPATLARGAVGATAGAGGALTGAAAASQVPDEWKPLAQLVGNVAGGAAVVAPVATGAALADAAAGKVGDFARPIMGKPQTILDATGKPILLSDITGLPSDAFPVMAKPGVQQMAGTVAMKAASDPAAAQEALANARQIVPGSAPTSYQATNDPGLGQLERAQAARSDLFTNRGQQQQAARVGLLQNAAGNADPGAVGGLAQATLERIQAQGEAQVDALRQQAQTAAEGIGGRVPASADGATALQSFGTAMREPLDAANTAAKASVSRMFNSWDPDGTARFDMSGVRNGAGDIARSIGPNAAPMTGEEAAIFGRARMMPTTQAAPDFQDFYSRVGDALRAARVDPAQAQSYRRLSQLMGFLHGAVNDTVAAAAKDDPSIAERMEFLANGGRGNGAQSVAAGQSYSGTPPQASGMEPVGAFGGAGTGSAPDRGFGNSPGRAGIPATARPSRPEGLVSFLTRMGGVYDDGGDLRAMGAARQRVGFLRRRPDGPAGGLQGGFGNGYGGFNSGNSRAGEPMQLDYARQTAIEAGYLPPDADLTDFKNAIDEDLRGHAQYVPEDQARYEADRAGNDPREQAAYDASRSRVLGAVDYMGADLRGVEVDHATRLNMLGVDPVEAVHQAADATRRDYLDGRIPLSEAGMPDHAEQARLAVDEHVPPGGGFLTQEAADRWAEARAAHKDRIDTFVRAPGVGKALAPGPTHGTFKMLDSAVPSAIWKSGAGAGERISAYLRAGGDPQIVQDYAAFDLRKAAEKPDGTLDPGKFQKWVDAHSEAMSSFPALRSRFDTAAAARRTMDDAAARVVAQQKDFQRSALARFTGDPDPVRTVQRILGAPDGPQQMGQLVEQVKDDPVALAGLRHAVMQRYLPLVEGQGFKQFPQALTKEWLAASKVLGPDQMAALRNIGADLKRSGRSIEGTKLPGGSNTVQDTAAAQRHGQAGHQSDFKKFLLLSLLEGGGDMLAHSAGMGGFKGLLAGTATAGVGFYLNTLRQSGLRSVDDLVALAAAHPPLMRALMAQVPETPSAANISFFRQQLTAALANATIQRPNAPALATGNGKPAVSLRDLPRVSAGGL